MLLNLTSGHLALALAVMGLCSLQSNITEILEAVF